MIGFEPRISGIGSDRSTNWATTTATNTTFFEWTILTREWLFQQSIIQQQWQSTFTFVGDR